MVQPSAITPPMPISTAPNRLRWVSPTSVNVVSWKRPMASAARKAPRIAPNTVATPKPGITPAVKRCSHSIVSAVGRT